jgi:hypothetical protein
VDIPNVSWDRKYGLFTRKYWKSELFGWSAGHGGDEYGNCSVYVSCALFSVVIFPGLCFQREIEVPDIGGHPFTDAMYYPKDKEEFWTTEQRLAYWRMYRDQHDGHMPE